MEPLKLPPHPRLYARPEAFARLDRRRIDDPWFQPYFEAVQREADAALDPATFSFPNPTSHNWHLVRARTMQKRIVTLVVQACVSGERRYVDAVMRHVAVIRDWEYWSWITWRQKNRDPLAIYDLSYGENAATLAIAYDWLADRLTAEEKAVILETARRAVDSYLYNTAKESGRDLPFWYRIATNNWNTVCNGGIGMLALALHEDLPEAEEIIARVEESIANYMDHLDVLGGAWEEGIGYWNYGMRYAFMYLLSYENATGRTRADLSRPSTKASLHFPLDFCPNGVGCSFGDANMWHPLPIHHEMARRLDMPELVSELRRVAPLPALGQRPGDHWPDTAEALLLVPDACAASPSSAGGPVARFYKGLDWGFLADRMPNPSLYMAVRGGTTEISHGHRDLTSFHLVMGNERMIRNIGHDVYMDTTFSTRRYELYDLLPDSKNVVLVNGLGVTGNSRVETAKVDFGGGLTGFCMDAGCAMGMMHDGPAVKEYHRLFLMVGASAFLIVDSLELPQVGYCELRLHTEARPAFSESAVQLVGESQSGALSLACNHPAALHPATALSTPPKPQPVHVVRWITRELRQRVVFAALFTPGASPQFLEVGTNSAGGSDEVVDLRFNAGGRRYEIGLSGKLDRVIAKTITDDQ